MYCRLIGLLVNNYLEGSGRGVIEVLLRYLTEGNIEKSHSGMFMSQPRFEPNNSRIKFKTVTANQPARIGGASSLSSVMKTSQALYGGGSYFLLAAFGVEV